MKHTLAVLAAAILSSASSSYTLAQTPPSMRVAGNFSSNKIGRAHV